MTSNLVSLNPDSSRDCPACGHAVPHSRGVYEATHTFCAHSTPVRIGCGDHGTLKSGERKGESRFSPNCANMIPSNCFIANDYCECSEEDRRIAELTKALIEIRVARDSFGGIGDDGVTCDDMCEIAGKALAATAESEDSV